MTARGPLIELEQVAKPYGDVEPLRIRALSLDPGACLVIQGLDAPGAEMFVNLLTGASLPDQGRVRIDGRDTRDISTDTDWLASLDRFGLVTLRAVLIGRLPVEQNLALPISLSIDPMPAEVRAAVRALADEVGIPSDRLSAPADELTPADLLRVHLARALAVRPAMLILEHPTVGLLETRDREAFGALVAAVARARRLGWLALSDDESFARGAAVRPVRLDPRTGAMARSPWWSRWTWRRR